MKYLDKRNGRVPDRNQLFLSFPLTAETTTGLALDPAPILLQTVGSFF